jgi:hypothetical protein
MIVVTPREREVILDELAVDLTEGGDLPLYVERFRYGRADEEDAQAVERVRFALALLADLRAPNALTITAEADALANWLDEAAGAADDAVVELEAVIAQPEQQLHPEQRATATAKMLGEERERAEGFAARHRERAATFREILGRLDSATNGRAAA